MQTWETFLKTQAKELGQETYQKWLKPLKLSSYDARNLYLEAQDTFQVLWFDEHMRPKLQRALLNSNGQKVKVHIGVSGSSQAAPKKTEEKKKEADPQKFTITFDELSPLYNFSQFVTFNGNLLVYKLLTETTGFEEESQENLATFNPIYLFGSQGCGKTHLLMATAHAFEKKGKKVAFVRAETFTEHVISAIRGGQMSIFRQAYRNVDLLIIDDIHLFSRKNATQEELFHTFNTLHMAGKQIILSSCLAPGELQEIEPRLVSRFEWGIVIPIELLPENKFDEMLKLRLKGFDCNLHPRVQQYLIETFKNSTSSLIKALEALLLRHHLKLQKQKLPYKAITVPEARFLLSDLTQEETTHALTPEKIFQSVAEYFGIMSEDIFKKTQSKDEIFPRHLAIYFCRDKLRMPYTKIGQLFSKDHSTIISSFKVIESGLAASDRKIQDAVVAICRSLGL